MLLSAMSFDLVPDKNAAKAAEEYAEQLHEIYKHECYGTKKKECKFSTLQISWYMYLSTHTA